jgi:hypothetical protein
MNAISRSDEERVSDTLSQVVRKVEIFSADDPNFVEAQINAWLERNPSIEIISFFPVAVSMAMAKAKAMAPKEIRFSTQDNNVNYPEIERETDSEKDQVAAVGIYYKEQVSA